MLNYKIITNNPLVLREYSNTIFIDGTTEEILIEARNLLHRGHGLISHPLTGSLKTILSPVKSIIIKERKEDIDVLQLEAVESSILKYKKLTQNKNIDLRHKDDFGKIDYLLLKSALEEMNIILTGGEFLEA